MDITWRTSGRDAVDLRSIAVTKKETVASVNVYYFITF
jgi:hypothetical protein